MKITKTYLNELTYRVIGAAIEVHKHLGAGLLESVYHQCLMEELKLRNIHFVSEKRIPVKYKHIEIETDLRCDLLIENSLIVELKAIEQILPIHEAKLLTYLKLMQLPKGIMINFNSLNIFHDGQKTYVNEYFTLLNEI